MDIEVAPRALGEGLSLKHFLNGERTGEDAVKVGLHGSPIRGRFAQGRRCDAVALARLQEDILEKGFVGIVLEEIQEVGILLAGPFLEDAARPLGSGRNGYF